MQPRDEKELEVHLRAAFEPDKTTVERVAASALRPDARRAVSRGLVPIVLAAAAVVVVLVSIRPSRVLSDTVQLEYVGRVALLEFSDGSSCLMTPDTSDPGARTAMDLIIVEGDQP